MNTKTTLVLFVALLALVLGYYVVQSRPVSIEATTSDVMASPTPSAAKDLLPKKLGDVVKVVYQRSGGDEWVFEKVAGETKPGQSNWKMIKPVEFFCTSYEVDKYGHTLGALQYEISHKPGDAGAVKPSDAGLEPPEAAVTLTDTGGQSTTIEIGRPAPGRGTTYVRLAGDAAIYVAKSDLKDLLKNKVLDFRDKQLWTFDNNNVTRVEIDDRTKADAPAKYLFTRDGARWMMQSPITARATNKVDDLLTAMNRLRVMNWHDDDAAKLKIFGLDPPAWTVRVTVEETIAPETKPEEATAAEGEAPSEKKADQPAEPPRKKTTVHELLVADVSPIGEDTKSYVRVGGENAVATIMKSAADKLKPVMNEWREMKITTANVHEATRIELKTREGAGALMKKDGAWSFEGDGGRAETSAVAELLKAVGDLAAVAFMDDEPSDPASLGFADPQAEVRLTVPGVEGVEKIAVGNYTDETAKRLVYVRRNDLASIAKVRANEVTKLLHGLRAYRDRTMVDVLPERFTGINLSTENKFVGGRNDATFEKHDAIWRMTAPVAAELKLDAFNKLVESLGGLRGEGIAGDASTESAYGLNAPTVTVTIHYQAVGESGSDAPPSETSTTQKSADRSLRLSFNEHEGKCYARRADSPSVFEVKKDFYQQLLAEFRTDRVMTFDDAKVNGFSVRRSGSTLAFEKKGDRWVCLVEPDLPLDNAKVQNLIVQFRDLKTPRYVKNAASDLSTFGLASPATELTISTNDGGTHGLLLSDKFAESGAEKGSYCVRKDFTDVFLLPPESVQRFAVSLETLEKGK